MDRQDYVFQPLSNVCEIDQITEDAKRIADGLKAIAPVSGGSDERCSHPADERVDLTEMGGPIRYLCRACGQEVTPTEMDGRFST